MTRTVPLLIAAITGFVIIIGKFIPYAQSWGGIAMAWFNILAAVAFILGGANLLKMNLQKISSREAGWGYSAVTLVAFLTTLIIGLGKIGAYPSTDHPEYAWSGSYEQEGSWLWWIFEFIFTPLNATMFALLAFFIASAAFRAFRAKNTEATVLLVTAFIVLLGRTSAGVWLTSFIPVDSDFAWLRIERLTDFIGLTFAKAGMRAIFIGIALGVVSTSLRILLGVDRSYLGSGRG